MWVGEEGVLAPSPADLEGVIQPPSIQANNRYAISGWNVWTFNELTNQNPIKVNKSVKPTNKKTLLLLNFGD